MEYRQVTVISEPGVFPLGRAKELLYEVAAADYITVIDMLRGYWQMPLDEEAKKYTDFVTYEGQYARQVMLYDLPNSTETSQRIINQLLEPHREYAYSCIDYVAVYSNTWEDHISHSRQVLETVTQVGLTANAEKCKFAQQEVKYLGHTVGSSKHAPDPKRLTTVQNISRPQNKYELRSFFGLCSYYSTTWPGTEH